MSYVRNLGFEDTPDYEYLRETLTSALQGSGEVEDGEYDWMKLNGGKGYMSKSQLAAAGYNQSPMSPTNRALHDRGQSRGQLNTTLNPKPGVNQRLSASNAGLRSGHDGLKRISTAQEADQQGSTTAQYGQSKPNLGYAASPNQPASALNRKEYASKQNSPLPATPAQAPPEVKKDSFMTKVMRVCCCRS